MEKHDPAKHDPAEKLDPALEGEGSRSADAAYRAGVEEHLERGHVDEEAEQARREVDADPEGFRRAEEEGKRHSAGDLPGEVHPPTSGSP